LRVVYNRCKSIEKIGAEAGRYYYPASPLFQFFLNPRSGFEGPRSGIGFVFIVPQNYLCTHKYDTRAVSSQKTVNDQVFCTLKYDTLEWFIMYDQVFFTHP
jgi:hypothetical protein